MKYITLIIGLMLAVCCEKSPTTEQPTENAESQQRVRQRLWVSKGNKTDVERDGFTVGVKTAKETKYEIEEKFGKLVRTITEEFFIKKYDREGNLLETVQRRLREKNAYTSRTLSTYDEKGNKTESAYYENRFTGGPLELRSKSIFKYDEHGNKVESTHYDSDGKIMHKNILKYDEHGNKVEVAHYDSNGKIREGLYLGKRFYTYDEIGNRVSEMWYLSDTKFLKKIINTYDKMGNKIARTESDEHGTMTNQWFLKYDSNGNRVEWRTIDGDSQEYFLTVYKYNKFGNLIESLFSIKGEETSKKMLEYDKNGNTKKIIWAYPEIKFDRRKYVPRSEIITEYTYWD